MKEEVSYLQIEKKRTDIAHKNEITHVNNDRKLKLETQRLTSERTLSEHQIRVKQLELTVEALQEKVSRQDDLISSQAKKCSKYDDIAAKAVNSNIDLGVCKEKAQMR